MPYFLNTPQDQQAMLAAIGAQSVDELFDSIPAELKLGRALNLPAALSELELTQHFHELAAKNASTARRVCFLGGGAYDHFIPAAVDQIAGRGEYYTSYTPYQAEASQGNLQAFFEYQTLVTQLFGLEVSNASLYDGATAATEAVLMCLGATGRSKVVVAESVNPEYREVLRTYLANAAIDVVVVPTPEGRASVAEFAARIDASVACVLVQTPNFFGGLESLTEIASIAHEHGALCVAAVDPLSLGVLKRPGDCGADVVVAEGQALGNPLAFGGPYLGMLACREALMRRVPGRLIGETVDRAGKRCWVLTLQTREQHIRRDKATSNICTNQGLFALRATIYLSLLGPQGLREVGELCVKKAHYAHKRLIDVGRLSDAFHVPYFKEFAVRVPGGQVDDLVAELAAQGIDAGLPLGRWYPEHSDALLVAVTEKRTRVEIDRLVDSVAAVVGARAQAHA